MKHRIIAINELMKVISIEIDKFFYSETSRIYAEFNLKNERLHYKDEWKGHNRLINNKMLAKDLMNWVNHGHTLRCQIIEFTNYIETGDKGQLLSKYWGCSKKSQYIIMKKAIEVGFHEAIGKFSYYDYGLSKTIEVQL